MARPRKPVTAGPLTLELQLRYAHTPGALRPYFEALQQGQALGSHCPQCQRNWFPPRLLCPYDRSATEWVRLSGRGRIINVTCGASRLPLVQASAHHCFALLALDGADNASFARIVGDERALQAGARVRLTAVAAATPHPAQSACFVVDDAGSDAS
jgi:uncharacterized OB-fold protein